MSPVSPIIPSCNQHDVSNSTCCPPNFMHQNSFVRTVDCTQPVQFHLGIMISCIIVWILGVSYIVAGRKRAFRGKIKLVLLTGIVASGSFTATSIAVYVENGFRTSAIVLWIICVITAVVFFNYLIKLIIFPLFKTFSRRHHVENSLTLLLAGVGISLTGTLITMLIGENMGITPQGIKIFNDGGIAYFLVNFFITNAMLGTLFYWSSVLSQEVESTQRIEITQKQSLLGRLRNMRKVLAVIMISCCAPWCWFILYFLYGKAPYYFVYVGLINVMSIGVIVSLCGNLIPAKAKTSSGSKSNSNNVSPTNNHQARNSKDYNNNNTTGTGTAVGEESNNVVVGVVSVGSAGDNNTDNNQ
jgi:hypothetical protein